MLPTHRYWTGIERPPMEPWLHHVVAGLHPNPVEWTDETLPDHIRQLADETAANALEEDRLRHRANVVRWALLAEYGGTWLDHDVIPLRRLVYPEARLAAVGGPGGQHGTWVRSSCIVYLPGPQHPLALWMTAAHRNPQPSPQTAPYASGDRLLATAPGVRRMPVIPLPYASDGKRMVGAHFDAVTTWATSSQAFS